MVNVGNIVIELDAMRDESKTGYLDRFEILEIMGCSGDIINYSTFVASLLVPHQEQ